MRLASSPTSGQTIPNSVLGADDCYWHRGVQPERGSPCCLVCEKLAGPCSPPRRTMVLLEREALGQGETLGCTAPVLDVTSLPHALR